MLRLFATSSLLLITTGCAGMSAYKRCQLAASFEQDPVARSVRLGNCEHIANREFAENIRREEHAEAQRAAEAKRDREELARAREHDRAVATERQRVRENPRVPDLGATVAESRQLCAAQNGDHMVRSSDDGERLFCLVGKDPIYGALVRAGEQGISHRTTFLENADLAAFRAEIEGKFGGADDVKIRGEYRAWTWRREGLLVMLSSYEKGVTLTAVAVPQPTPSAEPSSGVAAENDAATP